MPISYDLDSEICYVPFDFERYITSIKKASPSFANFKYFDHLTKSWLTLLNEVDQLLKDKKYLDDLNNTFENQKKEFLFANKKERYEVYYHKLDFKCGETFAIHYDIEKLHALFQNKNIKPHIIPINEVHFELTPYIKNKALDDRPIYVSYTPLISPHYTVVDGNHRITAKMKKGITASKGFIVDNAADIFVFEIEKLFYKFLYEMYLLLIQLGSGEKNHKRLWKDSYIYWLNNGRGSDYSHYCDFESYIEYSYDKIELLQSGETIQSESFIKRLISRFK